MTTTSSTLDRIQREIKEIKEREEELRHKYEQIYNSNNNNNYKLNNNNNVEKLDDEVFYEDKAGSSSPSSLSSSSSTSIPASKVLNNGTISKTAPVGRLFTPNTVTSTKGMMQKFLRSRGRISSPSVLLNNTKSNNNYVYEFQPAKFTAEIGKSPRNGFVSAEEKMRRELQEYQQREQELRQERRKSQSDLMAALEAEDDSNDASFGSPEKFNFPQEKSNLKSAKSLVSLYKNNEDSDDDDEPMPRSNFSNGGSNLKPSRSLAALCDISDEELDTPGTYSLIMQFEKMKAQQDRS